MFDWGDLLTVGFVVAAGITAAWLVDLSMRETRQKARLDAVYLELRGVKSELAAAVAELASAREETQQVRRELASVHSMALNMVRELQMAGIYITSAGDNNFGGPVAGRDARSEAK